MKQAMIAITKGLFEGKIKFSNTKQQPLINSSTIIQSTQLQKYLQQKTEPSLDIQKWLKEERNKICGRHLGIGKIILNKIRKRLQEIMNENEEQKYEYDHQQKYDGYFNNLSGNYSGSHGATYSVSGIHGNIYLCML